MNVNELIDRLTLLRDENQAVGKMKISLPHLDSGWDEGELTGVELINDGVNYHFGTDHYVRLI